MKRRISVYFMVALLIVTVLGGCSDGTGESSEDKSSTNVSGAEPVYGGSVVVGIQQDIDSLDPHKATAAGTKEILFNIFEGLLKPDPNGNLMNAVASDYSISEDGLVYTFTLREGVRFHNGNEVTAEDVKYSLERVSGILDGTALISTLSVDRGGIQSVDILDEKTVQVSVGSANLELIYSFTAAIIPAGSGEDEQAQPIGTGPFSFVSYKPQEGVVLAKNADYWQEGLPYLDEVNFRIVNSPDTALMNMQGGSIDIYPYLTDSQAAELAGDFQVLAAPSNVVQALFLNNADETLSDARVRQAICYALDKDSVNEFVFGGNGAIISSAMLPTLQDFYVDLNDVYGTGANIEKAKELLADAGYPDGIDLEIKVPSNYEVHMQTAEVVAQQLEAAGIRAVIAPVEWGTWLEEVYNGRQYQATISGITCDQTPGYLLNRFQTESSKNFINYGNAGYDETYVKAAASLDLAEKADYYKELQDMLTEDAGTAFLSVPPITVAVNPGISGYTFYPVYVQDMSVVYYTE
ncbi:MAG: ABC transporter substrate-binding protein [Clostridium sp.]|nr:ABC transporter substrate-binding protein [Acetatifactor muris]MCM1527564.1 ABC transporter substrate-binding protein [Bacteroides sp.]MCM1563806.1 ABC transporter substrate-binding protein [Clostridium sp.]